MNNIKQMHTNATQMQILQVCGRSVTQSKQQKMTIGAVSGSRVLYPNFLLDS